MFRGVVWQNETSWKVLRGSKKCQIWVSYSGGGVYTGRNLPTFRRNLLLHLRLWFYSDGQAIVDLHCEDGSGTFLRNVGNLCWTTRSHFWRRLSSMWKVFFIRTCISARIWSAAGHICVGLNDISNWGCIDIPTLCPVPFSHQVLKLLR